MRLCWQILGLYFTVSYNVMRITFVLQLKQLIFLASSVKHLKRLV